MALVRSGADSKGHNYMGAHIEMFLQVCRDYAALPDIRGMRACEIRFFYRGLRAELKEYSKRK